MWQPLLATAQLLVQYSCSQCFEGVSLRAAPGGREKEELIKDDGPGVETGHQATLVFCFLFSP